MENLDHQQLQAVWEQLARDDLVFFLEYESRGRWQRARHLDLLCSKLAAVERGELTRLIVTMPPRHGKSEVISKKFPAWYLGKNPAKEIILSSYAADLALDHSRIAMNTLTQWGHLWGVSLDTQAADRWTLKDDRGGCVAAGVGGPITGRGAHVAIIDDPLKNAEEADSNTIREKVWQWYRTTLRTRLAPNGAIILIMTRWHEDDLVGRLINEAKADGEQWEVISLPAEAEEGDPLGRKPGEWLWPERYPPNEYKDIKKAVGSRAWAALYQQRPSPAEGGLFKRHWWRYWHHKHQDQPPVPVKLPNGEITHIPSVPLPAIFDDTIQSWDCTFKDEKSSKSGNVDFVCGQVWGRVAVNKYLLDQTHKRMDLPDTMEAIVKTTKKWPLSRAKLVEGKANGPAVIQMLRRKVSGLIEVEPQGGKVARANAVSPDIESGNVYLPHPNIAPWVHDLIEEVSAFPNGKHDDMVDAMTQALNRWAGVGFKPRIIQQEPEGFWTPGELQDAGFKNMEIYNPSKKESPGYKTRTVIRSSYKNPMG